MGLIKAFSGAIRSELADQWKEYICADSMGSDTLVCKGELKTNQTKFSQSNTRGSNEIISNGSIIAVNEGQAMLVTVDGEIVDFACEPGAYTFEKGGEPSMFSGSFGQSLKETFKKIGSRFTFGGTVGKTHRVYYVNTKELTGNKFGSASPVPYDDPYYKTVLYIRYFGTYSLRISDPLMFYKNVAGNVQNSYKINSLIEQLNNEFYTALDSALASIATEGVKFSLLPAKQRELANYMNNTLDEEWVQKRGIVIEAVGINKVTPDDKSRERIEEFDNATMLGSNTAAMQGRMVGAQAKAFENMGSGSSGSSGMDFAGAAFGMKMMQDMMNGSVKNTEQHTSDNKDTWKCKCGATATGKFCSECGAKKPENNDSWTCECGATVTGKFCHECGKARTDNSEWICSACGTKSSGKFCSNCGKARE